MSWIFTIVFSGLLFSANSGTGMAPVQPAGLPEASANTVKQHIGNILAKLGSTDRRQAIARAAELGILSSDGG